MTPVSSLAGSAQIMGRAFPMTYFVPISVGTFTKGLARIMHRLEHRAA